MCRCKCELSELVLYLCADETDAPVQACVERSSQAISRSLVLWVFKHAVSQATAVSLAPQSKTTVKLIFKRPTA